MSEHENELRRLREANNRLNRRCTILEGAVRQMWDACRVDGVRLSRRHDRAWGIVREMDAGLLETAREEPAGRVAAAVARHCRRKLVQP